VYSGVGPCDTTNCIYVLHAYVIACIYIYIYIYTHTQYLYMLILCTCLDTLNIFYIFLAYTYIHTYVHTYIHIHSYVHTYMHAYIHIHPYICTYVQHTYIHTCTRAAIYVKMHSLNSSSKTGASSTHSSPCVGLLLVGQQLVHSEWSV